MIWILKMGLMMKTKAMLNLFVWSAVFFAASEVHAAPQETTLRLPDGSVAAEALVFSVSDKDRPMLMVNHGSKFQPNPIDANGKELIGVDDIEGGVFSRADEEGVVDIDRESHAHLVVAKSGESMAFVPRGTSGDVALRNCGRLKMDYSTLAKGAMQEAVKDSAKSASSRNAIRNDFRKPGSPPKVNMKDVLEDKLKDVTVIAHWKNNLAGNYAIVECDTDEYRLHKWFDIQFVFPDANAEVAVPPGEVSVGLLTAEQVDEMCKFRSQTKEVLFNKALRGFCISSFIHSINSNEFTRPPAFFGVCAKGKISERQQEYPKWEDSKVFAGGNMSGNAADILNFSPSHEDLKNPDAYVAWLLSSKGINRRIRVTGQIAWLENDGSFLTPPYPIAKYNFNFYPSLSSLSDSDRDRGFRRGRRIVDKEKQPIHFEVAVMPVPVATIVDFGNVYFEDEQDSKANQHASFMLTPGVKVPLNSEFRPVVPASNDERRNFPNQPQQRPKVVDSAQQPTPGVAQEPDDELALSLDLLEAMGKEDAATQLVLREKIEAAVREGIAARKKQLLELERRIKAARERLRKREENIEDIIDQRIKGLLDSSQLERDIHSFFSASSG